MDYVFGWAFPGLCELQRSSPGISLVLVCGGHESLIVPDTCWHFDLSPFILQVDFIPTSRGSLLVYRMETFERVRWSMPDWKASADSAWVEY